ncbi:MAG: putative peptidoglycan glycosyltransferase FtsW [Candidatus Paceibacterota bacterium]
MKRVDTIFLWLTVALVAVGFFIFISASLGLYAREGVQFSRVVFNQIFFGVVLGALALFGASKINYKFWRKYAFYIFLFSLAFTALVFIPGVGFSHGGATRWLALGPFSIQPAEILKIGFVIYFATWLSGVGSKVQSFLHGLLPLIILLIITGALLLLQPDTGTFLVILITGLGMFIIAGGRWLHLGALTGAGIAGMGVLALMRPYIKTRLLTFLDPTSDPFGAGYQIQQSLIAIGSGQWNGRGLGQSIQKFNYLPEPIGDSIFAVFAEEWGFIGSIILIGLFLAFALRGLKIASKAPNTFSRLLVSGLILLIVVQSFINIASMLSVFPLTGMPLIFVSQGGTALLVALASVGIILNVSKYAR